MNSLFESAWVRYVGLSTRRWARKYAERFPLHVEKDQTLRGFDPEKLQEIYIPRSNVGRRGKTAVNKLFTEMAKGGGKV